MTERRRPVRGRRNEPQATAAPRGKFTPHNRRRRPLGGRPKPAAKAAPPAADSLDIAVAPYRALDCPHFPPCAGCPLIPVPYEDQLVAKRQALLDELRPLLPAGAVPEDIVRPAARAPALVGYRNQARLVFRQMSPGGHAHIGLGMYAPGTHRVIHIPHCPIQPGRLNKVAATVIRLAEEMQFNTYDERTGTGCLRYLALRCDRTRKSVLVTIIAGHDPGAPLRVLAERVRAEHPEVVGVSLHVNARHSNVLFAGEDKWTIGAARLDDTVGPFRVFVSSRSFLQVNHAQADWIYRTLAERLGGDPEPQIVAEDAAENGAAASPAAPAAARSGPDAVPAEPVREAVLDFYCGIGGIAFHLGRSGRLVVGVEESDEAVEDARRAAHRNGARNTRFVAADVATFLRSPASFGVDLQGLEIAAVVLNPPRAGCGADVMQGIAALAPRRIAYVSCRPLSLVRDLEVLSGQYRIVDSTPVDMIPLTKHVESLTILERIAP